MNYKKMSLKKNRTCLWILKFSSIILSSLLFNQTVFAQYKCVNSKNISYSDLPTPICKQMYLTPYVKTKDKVLLSKKVDTEKVEANIKNNETGKKSFLYDKQACEQLQGYLKILQDGVRVARLDKEGNRQFLEDAQREQEITDTEKRLKETCMKP